MLVHECVDLVLVRAYQTDNPLVWAIVSVTIDPDLLIIYVIVLPVECFFESNFKPLWTEVFRRVVGVEHLLLYISLLIQYDLLRVCVPCFRLDLDIVVPRLSKTDIAKLVLRRHAFKEVSRQNSCLLPESHAFEVGIHNEDHATLDDVVVREVLVDGIHLFEVAA